MATTGCCTATFVAVFLSCWKGFSNSQIVGTFSSCDNLLPTEPFRETDFPDVTTTVTSLNDGQPPIESEYRPNALTS